LGIHVAKFTRRVDLLAGVLAAAARHLRAVADHAEALAVGGRDGHDARLGVASVRRSARPLCALRVSMLTCNTQALDQPRREVERERVVGAERDQVGARVAGLVRDHQVEIHLVDEVRGGSRGAGRSRPTVSPRSRSRTICWSRVKSNVHLLGCTSQRDTDRDGFRVTFRAARCEAPAAAA
jgi:hypothetical protein